MFQTTNQQKKIVGTHLRPLRSPRLRGEGPRQQPRRRAAGVVGGPVAVADGHRASRGRRSREEVGPGKLKNIPFVYRYIRDYMGLFIYIYLSIYLSNGLKQ